ncbi:sporulation integral membrane protein YlbJ [Clostridium niameyense]|uniref:sporulation integral membrane protein YlbJ n=1 Tax=Clostridium niameyense TaxID=1622073 RepID=UPI00067F52C4|nr:sporulation integral membrane protein YlbJ [Clostridium niameyense]
MNLLFNILIIIIVILLFMLFKNKSILIAFVSSLLIVYIIISPKACINATLSGANLFFYKVFPSLFTFLIFTNVIISYNGVHIYSKIFGKILCPPLKLDKKCSLPIVISAICGYPLGAKYSCDLYENKDITFESCERLINIASNAGPLFIIGSVGTSMLSNTYAGYTLLLSNYISCILMGILLPRKRFKYRGFSKNTPYKIPNIGEVLKSSVDNSIKTCLNVGGFVILFSVLLSIIKNNLFFQLILNQLSSTFNLDKNLIEGFILGILEMTNGCYLISKSSVNLSLKIILISFLLSFSGLSIISQVYSFTYKHNINMKRYIKLKFLQGILASLVSIILYKIPLFNLTLNTFIENNNFLYYYNNILFILLLFLLIAPLIFFNVKRHNKY